MEQRAPGIEVEDTEVGKAMEEIYEKWESSEEEQLKGKEKTKKKAEIDKRSRAQSDEKIKQNKKGKERGRGLIAKKT